VEKFQIDLRGDAPVYEQIADQIRMGVARGELAAGARLEPVRELARRLEVNASTVARAYQLLERDRVIETNRRGGSTVSRGQDNKLLQSLQESRLRTLMERSIIEALAQGYNPSEVQAAFELQLAVWRQRREAAAAEVGAIPHRLLRFAGSHDLALEALWAQARAQPPGFDFQPSYVGSLDGLLALVHGDAVLAGLHILDEESGEYNLPILQRLFPGGELSVVTLAERQQGFLVRPGNPRNIIGWADLGRGDWRYINRQAGSGTRTLLDYHLRQEHINPQQITGYDTSVETHTAVAAAVAEGRADAGLGLASAARAYGLEFVPLTSERYDLVCLPADRHSPELEHLFSVLSSRGFLDVVARLGGYDTTQTGRVQSSNAIA
jgi:molybdate-binding protein/DNA-binding transcriptional regulator YhcF (GntR family)